MKNYRVITLLLAITVAVSTLSCQKDNSDLIGQIKQLSERVSSIENQITQITSSISVLQQQGKLNSEEIASLKTLTSSLSKVVDDLKASGSINSTNIESLKIALQQSATTVQIDDVKKTIKLIDDLIAQNYGVQQVANQNTAKITGDLQVLITQLAGNLETLKTIENIQQLTGKIEKGGFTKGSLITLYEMDTTLSQTGRSFNTTIVDNYGSYNLKVKNLKGKITRAVADGFYFNEVAGQNSASRIALTGILKVDSSETLNINVLTHLERPRVEYLISHGSTFNNAKIQALTEVLQVFGITNPGIKRSEKINLVGSAKRNNILLAISTMLVGFRSDSQLAEILNDIAEDLKTDGQLDDISLGNDIETQLFYLDTVKTLNNIKTKYSGIYADSVLNKINLSNIQLFQNSTNFSKTYSLIEYPNETVSDNYQHNILGTITSSSTPQFEATANLKATGLKLKIEISIDFGSDPTPQFFLNYGNNENWSGSFSGDKKTLTLQTTAPGISTCGFSVQVPGINKAKLNIKYFENGSSTPTRTKTVNWN